VGGARKRVGRIGVAVAIFAFFLVLLVLIHAPCAPLDLFCRADNHQGVIGLMALGLALAGGVIAFDALSGDELSQRRVREREEHEARQHRERYEMLVRETLYEAVHNLHHLLKVIAWKPPPDLEEGEYGGAWLGGWPVCDFRYAQRMLDLPFVDDLLRDAPAVVSCLDHTLRNARYIDLHVSFPNRQKVVVRETVFMGEHLLRALVAARWFSIGAPATEAAAVLRGAGLESGLPRPDLDGAASVEVGLRDRVRFVSLGAGADERVLDTTIACFERDGARTPLLHALTEPPDPPGRPRL
jgi:hypothetical protein